jgi:TolB-like protein
MQGESPIQASAPTGGIFISYASQDAEAAKRICEALRAGGLEVWLDQSELRGGETWDRQIRKQIQDCALFIPVVSANAHARVEGYFRLEWKLAIDRSHQMAPDQTFLLPVVIDETSRADERIPDRFRELQWSRLPGGLASPTFVEHVRRLLSPTSNDATPPLHKTAPISVRSTDTARVIISRRPKVALLVFIVAILAAGGAYLVVDKGWLVDRMASSGPRDTTQSPSLAAGEKSIAVLPFADMSEDRDQEYFADGMAEEVIDLLTKIPQLRVIGRTSSFSFKGHAGDLRSIGERLGASYLVEGSVRRSINRIRVSAQVIDAHSGTHVWSDTYDRDFGEVLALQNQIASGVARALQLAVGADIRDERHLQNTEAYTFYLRGRSAIDRGDLGVSEAKTYLEQSLAIDPNFVRAAEALALAYVDEIGGRLTPSHVGWPAAVEAAQRALRLDSNSALAHAVLGLEGAVYAYDWRRASSELDATLALKPRDPYALFVAAWLAFDLGRRDEALKLQGASLALDPLNPDSHQNAAYILYLSGDLSAAEREFRRSIEISPTFEASHRMIGEILLQRQQPEAALREMEAESESTRDLGLALAYFALGRRPEADRAVARVERRASEFGELNVALIHAYRGNLDGAFQWLDKAVAARDLNLGHRLKYDPIFSSLRRDSRYKEVLRSMNLTD